MALLRNFDELKKYKFNDENIETVTSDEQIEVEENVQKLFHIFSLRHKVDNSLPKLLRTEHANFLNRYILYLPSSYQCLDASRTWLCYWILHSLSLLEIKISDGHKNAITNFLAKCQCKEGGFGGGPGQMPHLATTYAAINSLCIIGTEKAFNVINRQTMYNFLSSLRSPEGAFSMHKDGELDIRGVYCALSVATLINLQLDKLFDGTAEWVVSCQTYEGGFSGCPGMEAHGGYAFCGLASLILLQRGHLCDVQALMRWIVNRQMKFEGGFQGRTNKLVDGCYSFWQGGAFPLIHNLLLTENDAPENLLFNNGALQEYVLICCQHNEGGLLDKPGKPRDIYHTCYTLSGLSVAQHSSSWRNNMIGSYDNKLAPTHPVYNIRVDLAKKAMGYFKQFDVQQDLISPT